MSITPPRTGDLSPVDRFLARFTSSLGPDDECFVRLVLSRPRSEPVPTTPVALASTATAATPGPAAPGPIDRVLARLIRVRGERTLSLTLREATRDSTRNLRPEDAPEWLRSQLGVCFGAALLETTRGDLQISLLPDQPPRLVVHPPRCRVQPDQHHDRQKQRSLGPSANDWLEALGIVDAQGRPRPSRAAKLHQISRYAEILGHLVRSIPELSTGTPRVADMGCGRGYLTFAAWQLFHRQLGVRAEITGIDQRPELVSEMSGIAARLRLEGLSFVPGTIGDAPLDRVDALIALHACNTATDDAIRRGIAAEAKLIVVAPCCHQEVRPQLAAPEPFASLLAHGLLAERLAEWLTDALRTAFLEWAGYRVKVIEFVGSEHTPKNLLLAGVRHGLPFAEPALRERILELRSRFGLAHHALDPLLTLNP